ncbi:MAG TPA: sodium-dependent bicarbonate transport family permease [Deinococcales bacterium]|nr:sodium-dependent bicarbonate transport family permease [Deinococcales bacterium]
MRLNLLSPPVLAFALGVVAVLVRSDLRLPEELYTVLAAYLLLAIGLKGGVELAATPLAQLWLPALATLLLGLTIPIAAYAVLHRLLRFPVADAAAIAAHYGSVSVVTFTAAVTFVGAVGAPSEGFMPTLVAILEAPAILVSVFIARSRLGGGGSMGTLFHDLFAGRGIFLLLGGLVMGALTGREGLKEVSPFFVEPFKGALTLFLLELGMVAAGRMRSVGAAGPRILAFGVLAPLVQGALGAVVGTLAGLSLGGTTVMAVMAASASYIAAPAAVRIAIPQANPGLYLGAALGVTFPFNLSVGIPVYYAISRLLHGV